MLFNFIPFHTQNEKNDEHKQQLINKQKINNGQDRTRSSSAKSEIKKVQKRISQIYIFIL